MDLFSSALTCWDGIFKLLRNPGIDFKESIPRTWWTGMTTLFLPGSLSGCHWSDSTWPGISFPSEDWIITFTSLHICTFSQHFLDSVCILFIDWNFPGINGVAGRGLHEGGRRGGSCYTQAPSTRARTSWRQRGPLWPMRPLRCSCLWRATNIT